LLDRDGGGANEVAARLGDNGRYTAVGYQADITDADALEAAASARIGHFGELSFAVACAGIGDTSSMADGDPERWGQLVETNVLGTMFTARASLRHLVAAGKGDIVIVASLSGLVAYESQPIYLASKWATVGFTRALRIEAQRHGVRVTLVAPGLVDTPLARNDAYGRHLLETTVALEAVDVAECVLFALEQPPHVAVNEIVMRPRGQAV
jgi:NADP-dependent 3-hydroxy acid dehydrogenase YdfG